MERSDTTAKGLVDSLLKLELLTTEAGDRRAPYRVAYPLPFSPVLLTGLFPRQTELDMLADNLAQPAPAEATAGRHGGSG